MTCNAGSMASEAFLLPVCATSEPTWEEPGACDVEAQNETPVPSKGRIEGDWGRMRESYRCRRDRTQKLSARPWQKHYFVSHKSMKTDIDHARPRRSISVPHSLWRSVTAPSQSRNPPVSRRRPAANSAGASIVPFALGKERR